MYAHTTKEAIKEDVDFDPLQDLFVAQVMKPDYLRDINLRVLSPFQRALLVIDGTVTKFIEAYTMEPVEIIRLSQSSRVLPTNHPWLEAQANSPVIAREVILQGRHTARFFAYATSLVVPHRLPPDVRQHIDEAGDGLGRILLNSKLETRREVLWCGRESTRRLPPQVKNLGMSEFISRTYRIILGGKPIMLINEKFASTASDLPAHH